MPASAFFRSPPPLRAASVTAIEGDAQASADLHANGKAAGGQMATLRAPVESVGAAGAGVLSRIPRHGHRHGDCRSAEDRDCRQEAVAAVLRVKAPRLIYVSCDVATLARDARKIVDAGYTSNAPTRSTCFQTRRTWRRW